MEGFANQQEAVSWQLYNLTFIIMIAAIIQKRERELVTLSTSLDEAYAYLGSSPETLEDARFFFNAGREAMVVA